MKTTRARSRILVIAGSAVGAFAIFCGSVALFGAWWRFENMPTAEEWQALFGATVLVAIGLTRSSPVEWCNEHSSRMSLATQST